MRITDAYTNPGVGAGTAAGTTRAAATGTTSDASTQGAADAASQGAIKVTVSAKARELADAASASDPDDAKVSQLRAAIQNGTLQVNSAQIAQRIVDGG